MKRNEAGMTLVELLAAISILAIISFSLTESIIQALRTTDGTAKRYGQSFDAQTLAASFSPDIQSADSIQAPFTPSGSPCLAGSGTPELLLSWTDGSISKEASYTLDAGTGEERHLVRRYCEADSRASNPAPRLVRQHPVATFVDPEGTVAPVQVTCQPIACPTLAPTATNPDQPRSVIMQIREKIVDERTYTFEVTGARRAA